jgi:heterodisulfide reductase subunit C
MPLASEDKSYIRDLIHEVRDVQKQTNKLLEEIRDLLKSPHVTIEQRPAGCTCGKALAICPVHRR